MWWIIWDGKDHFGELWLEWKRFTTRHASWNKEITTSNSVQFFHDKHVMECRQQSRPTKACKLNQPSHHCWSFCDCDRRFLSLCNHLVGQHPVDQSAGQLGIIYNISAPGGDGKSKMMLSRNVRIAKFTKVAILTLNHLVDLVSWLSISTRTVF